MRTMNVASAILAVAGISASVLADGRVTITDATGFYNGTDGAGGAFTVTRATPAGNGDYNGQYGGNGTVGNVFLSFCVEFNEHLRFGDTYYSEISVSAKNGGVSGGNPDPISPITARLYSEFRSGGNFGGTVFGASYDTSAETTAIQYAIWYAEGERTLAEIGGAGSLAEQVYDWAAANNNGSINNVRVLRLWDAWTAAAGYSGNHQDLLTIVPLPPAAWAGLGTLGCVLGVSVIRRRKLHA